jgi:predicted phosphodiesterase
MKAIAAHVQQVCFHGHTHLPGIFTLAESDNWSYQTPDELNGAYRLTDGPVLCNVGSVGQPRDCDSRACYVLFDGESIRYRRVPYEIEATIQKIHTAPNIPNLYGDRLPVGR